MDKREQQLVYQLGSSCFFIFIFCVLRSSFPNALLSSGCRCRIPEETSFATTPSCVDDEAIQSAFLFSTLEKKITSTWGSTILLSVFFFTD